MSKFRMAPCSKKNMELWVIADKEFDNYESEWFTADSSSDAYDSALKHWPSESTMIILEIQE